MYAAHPLCPIESLQGRGTKMVINCFPCSNDLWICEQVGCRLVCTLLNKLQNGKMHTFVLISWVAKSSLSFQKCYHMHVEIDMWHKLSVVFLQ